jgi:uncharacterized protein YaaR (DUF327 family)
MSSGYNDNENKTEWQEDKSNDQTSSDPSDPGVRSARKEWAQKMYLKEIDSLFKGKKSSEEHTIAFEEIHKRSGTKKFNTAVKKYIKEYGLPDDWSTLSLLLDYKDVKVVKDVIKTLLEKIEDEPLSLKEGFKSKMNIIAMTTTDDKLRDAVEEALEEL